MNKATDSLAMPIPVRYEPLNPAQPDGQKP